MMRRAAAGVALGTSAFAYALAEAPAAQCEAGGGVHRGSSRPLAGLRSAVSERTNQLRAACMSTAAGSTAAAAAQLDPPSAQLVSARENLQRALWMFGPGGWRVFASAALEAAEAQGLELSQQQQQAGAALDIGFALPHSAQPSEVLACALGVVTKCAPMEPSRRLASAMGCLGRSMQDAMRGASFSLERDVHTTAVRTDSGAEVVLRLNIVSGEARLDLRTAQLEASDAVRLATAFRTAHMPPAENQWSPGDPDLSDNLAKTSFMPDS